MFLQSLSFTNICWPRRQISERSGLGDKMFKLFHGLHKLKLLGCEFANVHMQQIYNPFWKDVLKHYKKLYTKCLPENIHDFVSECIHYNINITINKMVVYIKDWFDAGIIFVLHLMDNNGNYLTFKTFKQLFSNVRTIFSTCRDVMGAIKKYQHGNRQTVSVNMSGIFKLAPFSSDPDS